MIEVVAHGDAARSFLKGLVRHGENAKLIDPGVAATSDIVVVWGWRKGEALQRDGRHVLVMERGYIGDRYEWTSLAWDGLNGRGAVPAISDGGARWTKYFGELLKPWREGGEDVLIMGQVAGDMSLAGVDIAAWYRRAAARFPGAVFRPHPVATERGYATPEIPGLKVVNGSLAAALERARCVVTFNSNAGVDAVINGVPAIACDQGSMAWPVAAQGLGADLVRPDRAAWCERIAWRQWRLEEIERGEAWDYLRRSVQ